MRRDPGGWLIIAALAMGIGGCGKTFEELDFTFRSVPPVPVTVSYEEIRIPEGIGVGVIARPFTDDGQEMDEDTEVGLESKNPGILMVGPSQPNEFEATDKTKQNWTFVIYGAQAGTTEVTVRVKGNVVTRIPAIVDPQ